jgi:hypothetical protein
MDTSFSSKKKKLKGRDQMEELGDTWEDNIQMDDKETG